MKSSEIVKLIESKIELYEEMVSDAHTEMRMAQDKEQEDFWRNVYRGRGDSLLTLQVLLSEIKGESKN